MASRDETTRSRREILALAAGAAAGLAGCSTQSTDDPTPDTTRTSSPTAADSDATDTGTATQADRSPYERVYAETIPSVVLIRVYDDSGPVGQGSGFVHPDGSHVVTNQHVVEGGETVRVRFHDGTWAPGEIRGTDVYSDLAVLTVETPSTATPLELVDEPADIGTQVVALGAPFSLGGSVSAGIVSGVDRSLPSQTGFSISDAVQTDAAVNPGNSGGPLVTLDGRVAAVINSGQGENVNFGISAALTRRVVPALVEDGSYAHPFMGIRLTEVTPAIAEGNGLDAARGILVIDALPDGPAEGVLRASEGGTTALGQSVPTGGDVIIALDDTQIRTEADLASYLATQTSPGDTIDVRIIRDGTERTVSFELGTRPAPEEDLG
jgi:S1-C subfamily serine protease